MLALAGRGRGVVWGLPGLPRNSCSSGSQVTAETWWILLALKAGLFSSRKETPSKKNHLCYLFCQWHPGLNLS